MSSQLALGHNIQSSGLSSVISTQLSSPTLPLSSQNPLISGGPKDVGEFMFHSWIVWIPTDLQLFALISRYADVGHSKGDEQQQQNLFADMNGESTQATSSGMIKGDESLKTRLVVKR